MTNGSTTRSSFLDTPLAATLKLDVEKGLYLLFTLAAVFTRFWRLGDRVMSHDESLHTYFSWLLYMGRGFQHTPLMHGPFLFHINALIYALFGADDLTARISTAVFGVVLILLPWTLRRWLGRTGALVTSFMLLISPMVMYHARYIRDESYDIVWVMLIVWAIFAYLRDRRERWLYLLVSASILFFASMEVSFIFTAIFGSFLALLAAVEFIRLRGWGLDGLSRLMIAVAGVLGILVVGTVIQSAYLIMRGLGPTLPAAPGAPAAAPPVLTNQDIVLNLVIMGVIGAIFGVAAYGLLRALMPGSIRDVPAFDLAIMLVVFYLPAASPLAIKLAGFDPVDYGTAGIVRAGGMFMPFLAVSIALGVWWNWRRFLVAAGIWYGIFVTLFTTVFTNGAGLATGMIGSLGYWLAQQAVQRGSQPVYYYVLLVPLYEYLPLVVSSLAVVVYIVQGFRFPASASLRAERAERDAKALRDQGRKSAPEPEEEPETAGLEREMSLFVLLLVYWLGLTWIVFSYAGEKMPWLTTYFAMPMILISGHFLGRIFDRLDWKALARGWVVALLVPLFVIALVSMVGALQAGAFQGKELAQLTASGQWFSSFVVSLGALVALVIVVPRVGVGHSARIICLEALALLAALTIRTAWQWNTINYDYPIEYGVYAHGGDSVKIAMSQVEDISRRTAGERSLKMAYDSDSSWPFSWYLRDYPNAALLPTTPTRDQLNVPVVILGSASWATVEPILGDKYDKFNYRLIWWPMEDYKGKNGKSLTMTEVMQTLSNPQMLKAIWNIWLSRDFKLYDELTKEKHTLDSWPLVHDFRLYVRKDISNQMWDQRIGPAPLAQLPVDPYLKGRRDIAAVQTIGELGNAQGQFTAPHGLAVAPDGSLYVADSNNHRIQKFDASGKFLLEFGTFSGPNNANPASGTFNEPWGVAVGPDGNVYVADTWNHRIQKFDPNGKFIKMWGTPGQTDINGQGGIFWGPRGVAVDKGGRVYVTDTGNKRIEVFSSDGEFITQFGGAGVQPGQLDEPVGIAVDPTSGNLVVNDTWNQRIQVLTPEGQPVRQWEVKGWLDQSVTNKPYVAVDKDSNVYTVDPTGFRVLVFGPDGTFKATFGDVGTDEKSFQLPIGIAVDDSGNIYVSDAGLSRILKFAPVK